MIIRTWVLAFSFISFAIPVHADEETELLRQQIKILEARLDALEKKKTAPEQVQNNASATPNVEKRLTVLEHKEAATQAETDALAKKTASVEVGKGKGVVFTSPDKEFQLRIGGYIQADDHAFIGTHNASNTDQFFIRSARPIFESTFYDKFAARLMLDYGNGQTTLLDAYGDYKAANAFNLRIGKFKDSIGIERWQAEQNILFVERGMTTNLVPYRDNGVQVYGELMPKILEYQVSLTNGSPDLVNSTNNTDDDQAVTARVFAHPFASLNNKSLQGLGAGIAGSYGNRNSSISNPNLTSGYVTPAQTKFFTYLSGGLASNTAYASGGQWRINPQLTYYKGPFSFISEYVLENQGIKLASSTKDLQNNAWEAIMTYVLTGENASFTGVVPNNDFDAAHDKWGAFELVGRFSMLRIDDATFPLFASLAQSAKEAREMTFGGTWYMNSNVKLNLDFAHTTFDGGAVGGDRPAENAVLSRAQFKF
jgi:phosphate-selective porin OprO/OprP